MKPTLQQVLDRARSHLADNQVPGGEEFVNSVLYQPFCEAHESLAEAADNHSIPAAQRTVVFAVKAGDTSLDPSTAHSDFTEPDMVEDRPTGTTTPYREVIPVMSLNGQPQEDGLIVYKYEDGILWFVGATTDRDVRINYTSNGATPTAFDSTLAFPDSLRYLGLKTAALALEPVEGGGSLSARLEQRAQEALDSWLHKQLRQTQAISLVRPRFGVRRR